MGLRPTQNDENPWVFDRVVAASGSIGRGENRKLTRAVAVDRSVRNNRLLTRAARSEKLMMNLTIRKGEGDRHLFRQKTGEKGASPRVFQNPQHPVPK